MGRDGIDLLHAPGYIAPLASGVPVVLTVYDLIALRHPRWCKRSNALHYGLMLPPSVRKAARIIVPSEATRRDVAERFPAASPKVRVIPLGVGEQYRRLADRGAVRRACDRYGLPERFILFVGTQEPKKNVPGLLRAFQLLRSGGSCAHKLALAGRRGWGRADVPARIRELGLTGEVVMTGYVPDGDLVCLYNAADLFVFPSLYEGFGLPPLEAMACGVPVVCSTAGGLADVVAGAALTAEPGDAPALAAAMREGLTDAALRGRLAAAGAERAAQFTWRRHAEQVERLYREVLLISGGR